MPFLSQVNHKAMRLLVSLRWLKSADIPVQSPGHQLPAEVWLRIAGFLPLSSQASLALTCMYMASLLQRCWIKLNDLSYRDQRRDFLRSLEIMFPDHFLCPSCEKYHKISSGSFDYSRRSCKLQSCRITLTESINGDAEWLMLHLVMRSRWLSRTHGLRLDTLSRTNPIILEGKKQISNISAQITCEHRLMLRVATYAPVECTALDYSTAFCQFQACIHQRHCRTLSAARIELLTKMKRYQNDTKAQLRRQPACLAFTPLFRCPHCPSEYQMTLSHRWSLNSKPAKKAVDIDTQCRFVLTTKWYADFGHVRHPLEPEWKALSGMSFSDGSDIERYATARDSQRWTIQQEWFAHREPERPSPAHTTARVLDGVAPYKNAVSDGTC